MTEQASTLFERMALRVEEALMTRLLPKTDPGPVFKWLFKVPVFFYRIGLPLFGDFILLLSHRGRKSGKLRHTPLEYRHEASTGDRIIMAGWGGNTDWRRNIEAEPQVTVQAGRGEISGSGRAPERCRCGSFPDRGYDAQSGEREDLVALG